MKVDKNEMRDLGLLIIVILLSIMFLALVVNL